MLRPKQSISIIVTLMSKLSTSSPRHLEEKNPKQLGKLTQREKARTARNNQNCQKFPELSGKQTLREEVANAVHRG